MSSKFVLLVEDNPDDEELALLAFRNSRLANDVAIVRDGQEALDFLFCEGTHRVRDPALRPQVILLDLKLPRIDGLDVLRRVRGDARTKRLPVVVLSSSNEEEDLVRSYDLGANSYIRKPVNFARFAEAIHQLQMYWLVLNEPPRSGA